MGPFSDFNQKDHILSDRSVFGLIYRVYIMSIQSEIPQVFERLSYLMFSPGELLQNLLIIDNLRIVNRFLQAFFATYHPAGWAYRFYPTGIAIDGVNVIDIKL